VFDPSFQVATPLATLLLKFAGFVWAAHASYVLTLISTP
jgi:hypothetical protein